MKTDSERGERWKKELLTAELPAKAGKRSDQIIMQRTPRRASRHNISLKISR